MEHRSHRLVTNDKVKCVWRLLMLLSTWPLSASSRQGYYYLRRNDHPTMFTTLALPSANINQIPTHANNFQHSFGPSPYVPHLSPDISETTFHGADAFQKLVIPIPHSQLVSSVYNNLIIPQPTEIQTVQGSISPIPTHTLSPILHHPFTYNQDKATPLHITHPTIQVPKVFSHNPPKYIQVLQFPKVIRPFQQIKPTSDIVKIMTTQPPVSDLTIDHREPVFSGYTYTILNSDDKPVFGTNSIQAHLKQINLNVSESEAKNNIPEDSKPMHTFAPLFGRETHDFNQITSGTNTRVSYKPTIAPEIRSEEKDVFRTQDTSASISREIFVLPNSEPPRFQGNAEIELSELIDTFSISKLTEGAKHVAENSHNISSKDHIDRFGTTLRPFGETTTIREVITSTPQVISQKSLETNLKKIDKLPGFEETFSKPLIKEHSEGSSEKGKTMVNIKPGPTIAEQLKIKSLLFWNPRLNLLEKYSKPVEPTTEAPVPIPTIINLNESDSQIKSENEMLTISPALLTTTTTSEGPLPVTTEKPPLIEKTSSAFIDSITKPTEATTELGQLSTSSTEQPSLLQPLDGSTEDITSTTVGAHENTYIEIVTPNTTISNSIIDAANETVNASTPTPETELVTTTELIEAAVTQHTTNKSSIVPSWNTITTNATSSTSAEKKSKQFMKRRIRVVLKRKSNDPTRRILSRKIYLKVQKLQQTI